MTLLVVGGVEEDEALELAVGVEHLDAAVVAIGDVDVVLAIDADVVRRVELAGILVRVRAAACRASPTTSSSCRACRTSRPANSCSRR